MIANEQSKIWFWYLQYNQKNIKKYRKEKKITSAQLAEMVGLSHDFIRQIQSEKAAYNFSVETFYKIAVALDVSLDSLVKKEQ